MAKPVIGNPFVHIVVNGFVASREQADLSAVTWVQESLFNPAATREDVDKFAKKILSEFQSAVPKNDSKRYQFRTLKESEELLKIIFEESFQHKPAPVIAEAQRITGSFYPLWKQVCLIHIPKTIESILGNTLVKIVISVATVYYSHKFGNAAYGQMVRFFTAKGLPFVINNTPITVIRCGNRILNAVDYACQRKIALLFSAFVVQQIILRVPNVPYFTAAVRSVSIWRILDAVTNSPQTLFDFLRGKAYSAATFMWDNCGSLSAFFGDVAVGAKGDRLAISKSKSYDLWKRSIATNTPQRA
jgi:hypothetical protein